MELKLLFQLKQRDILTSHLSPHILSYAMFGGGSCNLLITNQGRPSNWLFLYTIQNNFLHCRSLACKFLATMEVKSEEKEIHLMYSNLYSEAYVTYTRKYVFKIEGCSKKSGSIVWLCIIHLVFLF